MSRLVLPVWKQDLARILGAGEVLNSGPWLTLPPCHLLRAPPRQKLVYAGNILLFLVRAISYFQHNTMRLPSPSPLNMKSSGPLVRGLLTLDLSGLPLGLGFGVIFVLGFVVPVSIFHFILHYCKYITLS